MDTIITLTYENDDNEEVILTLPSCNQVCPECDGNSYVLCEGMRGHAYSAEEFYLDFDQEEREEYFKPGGRYDVLCPVCGGKNVIPIVNQAMLNEQEKVDYALWQEYDERRARYEAEDRATMRAENGYQD